MPVHVSSRICFEWTFIKLQIYFKIIQPAKFYLKSLEQSCENMKNTEEVVQSLSHVWFKQLGHTLGKYLMGFFNISCCHPHLYNVFICRTAVLEIRNVALLNGCPLKICILSHVSVSFSFASCSVQGHSFPWLCWQPLLSRLVAAQVVGRRCW